jgi:hypothetical protein
MATNLSSINNPEFPIEQAMDIVCVIEDVIDYAVEVTTDEFKNLIFKLAIYRQKEEGLLIQLPALQTLSMTRQQIVILILRACGWEKAEEYPL